MIWFETRPNGSRRWHLYPLYVIALGLLWWTAA